MIKYVIVGVLFMLLVQGALFALTEGLPSTQPTQQTTPIVEPNNQDNQFKNLKVN